MGRQLADHCASKLQPQRCVCLPPASSEQPVNDQLPRRPLYFTVTMASMVLSEHPVCHIWMTNATILSPVSLQRHYNDVIMDTIASQITSLTIVYSTFYSGADQRKHQSSASLAFVRGIHRRPVNSPHKWPVTRKLFPFDDVIMDDLARFRTR